MPAEKNVQFSFLKPCESSKRSDLPLFSGRSISPRYVPDLATSTSHLIDLRSHQYHNTSCRIGVGDFAVENCTPGGTHTVVGRAGVTFNYNSVQEFQYRFPADPSISLEKKNNPKEKPSRR